MRRISSGDWAFIQAFVWTPITTLAIIACFDWLSLLSGVCQAAIFLVYFYVAMAPCIYAIWIVPAMDARKAKKKVAACLAK